MICANRNVACPTTTCGRGLRDPRGVAMPLVHRLQARGAMELTCPELHAMARRQGLLEAPAAERGQRERDEL